MVSVGSRVLPTGAVRQADSPHLKDFLEGFTWCAENPAGGSQHSIEGLISAR